MALKRIKEHMLGFRNGFNSETFTATTNQTLFTLTNGSYQVGKNRLEVYIQGAKQAAGAFSETSENSFTLSEGVPAGTLVEAKWYETIIPAVGGHNQSHLKGGVDALDITQLQNYKEQVSDKFVSVNTQLADIIQFNKNVKATTATDIETYLNSADDGSEITFPKEITYALDRQIVLLNKHNLKINFNGSTFRLNDNLTLSSRTVYIGETAYSTGLDTFILVGCSDVAFENLSLDGNRINNTQLTSGLRFENTQRFYGKNINIKSFYDKHITIRNGSTKIFFDGIEMSDKGETEAGAYIFSSTPNGEYHLNNCIINGIYQDSGDQFLYSADGTWFINNIDINNIPTCFDFRRGRGYIEHVKVDTCGMFAITQPYPSYPTDPYPFITIKNAEVNNCKGATGGNAGCYIVSGGMEFEKVTINMDSASSFALSGIRVKKADPSYLVATTKLKDTKINYATSYGAYIDESEARIEFKNCNFDSGETTAKSTSAINITSAFTGEIVIENCKHRNYYQLNTDTANLIKTDGLIARTTGTTTQRPVFPNYRNQGFLYFDMTLGKPIWWTGTAWKDAVGTTV